MTRETKKMKVIRLVERLGYQKDGADRSKYTAFKIAGSDQRYFVGDNGALRCGRTASESISISHLLPAMFEKFGIK